MSSLAAGRPLAVVEKEEISAIYTERCLLVRQ
jgi:hypothetical protein